MAWRVVVLLLVTIAGVYWPALGGDYVYDDLELIVRNPALQNLDILALLTKPLFGTEHGYWRPLMSLLLCLGHHMGGAAGVHTLSLLIHASAALLVLDLGGRLFHNVWPAFWSALLFALHPVQVESVAWCSAINGPTWTLCMLCAMRSAVRWSDGGRSGTPWRAAVCCFVGLLAKETTLCAIPLIFAAAACARATTTLSTGSSARPSPARSLGIAIMVAILGWLLLRILVFRELTAGLLRGPEQPPLEASQFAIAATEMLLRLLALLVVPFPLQPFRTLAAELPWWSAVTMLATALGLFVAWVVAFRRATPVVRLALASIVLPLLPTALLFRSLGAYPVADRYLCFAALGVCLLIAHWSAARHRCLPALLAAASAALSFSQTWVWRDQASLVQHGLRWSDDGATLHVMAGDLALAKAQGGDAAALDVARRAYRAAATQQPPGSPDQPHRARAAAELGLAWCMLLEQQGKRGPGTSSLLAAFERAVATDASKAAAWVGLGVANGIAERPADAERAFRKALELDPDHAEAWFNLGFLQLQQNRVDQARASLQEALRRNPQGPARQLLLQLR